MLDGIHLDYAAIGKILKEDMRGPIDALAEQIAGNARGNADLHGEPITVQHFTTDRAGATVNIASAAGLALQAKHGILTRAASAAGLEVRAK